MPHSVDHSHRAIVRPLVEVGLALAIGLLVPETLLGQKADTLVMNNGDVITGEIKALGHGQLSYGTDDMGTLTIKWDKVFKLVTRNYYEFTLDNGWKYYGSLAWPDQDRRLVIQLTVADTVNMDRVVEIARIRSSFFARTDGHVDLGFNLTRANRQTEWSLNGRANYRGPKWGGYLEVNSYFRFQEDTASNTSRNTVSLFTRRFFRNNWAGVASVAAEQNEEINLELRTITGLGPAYDVIRSNRMNLGFYSSLVATNEKYSTSPEATLNLELLLGGAWEAFQLDSPKLDLLTTLQVFPSLTDLGRVRTQWDFRFSYELLSDFTVGLNGFVSYDNQPPTTNAVKLDYRTSFTLGWKWS
jgi:hypothetical protein